MTEWRNEIVQIENVHKHPNADNLDIVTVLGDYPVITKHNEYKPGDLACYISENTLVPDIDIFYFLAPCVMEKYFENGEFKGRPTAEKKYPLGKVPEKYRIVYSKKIRGEYSEGLLLPVPNNDFKLGDSVVDFFGLQKVDEKEEEETVGKQKAKSVNSWAPATRKPETWDLPYYDIDPLRSNLNRLWPSEEVALTLKCHGSFYSVTHDGTELWVKSRKVFKKETENSPWWKVVRYYNLKEKLKAYPMFSFWAEIVGHQNTKAYQFLYDAEVENNEVLAKLHFFHIYDVEKRRKLHYDDTRTILKDLGLPIVKQLYRGPWLGKEKMYKFAEGPDPINPKHVREGFVLQTLDRRREEYLGPTEYKHVGEGYKLSKQGIRLALDQFTIEETI
jgi:RNA ligase (TIGR02306 family)